MNASNLAYLCSWSASNAEQSHWQGADVNSIREPPSDFPNWFGNDANFVFCRTCSALLFLLNLIRVASACWTHVWHGMVSAKACWGSMQSCASTRTDTCCCQDVQCGFGCEVAAETSFKMLQELLTFVIFVARWRIFDGRTILCALLQRKACGGLSLDGALSCGSSDDLRLRIQLRAGLARYLANTARKGSKDGTGLCCRVKLAERWVHLKQVETSRMCYLVHNLNRHEAKRWWIFATTSCRKPWTCRHCQGRTPGDAMISHDKSINNFLWTDSSAGRSTVRAFEVHLKCGFLSSKVLLKANSNVHEQTDGGFTALDLAWSFDFSSFVNVPKQSATKIMQLTTQIKLAFRSIWVCLKIGRYASKW